MRGLGELTAVLRPMRGLAVAAAGRPPNGAAFPHRDVDSRISQAHRRGEAS